MFLGPLNSRQINNFHQVYRLFSRCDYCRGHPYKGPFTRAIFVAIFLILTHAIEWLSHKSIDLYSFAQMVQYIRKSIHLIACIKRGKIAAKIACVNGP